MRKILFAFALLAACVCVTSSCRSDKDMTKGKTVNIEHRKLKVDDFTAIINKSNAHIVYTQGAKQPLEIEERGTAQSDVYVKDNTLYIMPKGKYNSGGLKMETWIYITAEQINRVENHGNLHYESSDVKVSEFTMRNSGNGKFDFGNIKSNNRCEIRNSGNGSIDMLQAFCTNFMFTNSGNGSFYVKKVTATEYSVRNSGNGSVEVTASGQKGAVTNSGNGSFVYDLMAYETTVNNSGNGKITGRCEATKCQIHNSGVGSIELILNCKEFAANNSGNGKISVSGTADKVDVTGSGVSNIDLAGLNKF